MSCSEYPKSKFAAWTTIPTSTAAAEAGDDEEARVSQGRGETDHDHERKMIEATFSTFEVTSITATVIATTVPTTPAI